MERQFKRHNGWDIFIHWFNLFCWVTLFFTGMGLIKNENLAPLWQWWPDLMRGLFGGGANLLLVHEAVGLLWVAGFVLYLIFNAKGAVFFLKEVFSVNPARDLAWMLKKPLHMLLGDAGLKKFGLQPGLPPQGFYNMGQKGFAQAAVLGGIGLVVTGVIMLLSQTSLGEEYVGLVQWSVFLHFVCAALVFVGLLVHIYMAAIAPEERPAFKSMFTGSVPESYARHHHELWYHAVKNEPQE